MLSSPTLMQSAETSRPRRPTTVLVVGDPTEWVPRGQHLTGGRSDLEVLGVVDSGAEAVELVLNLQPDVVLVDVNTSDLSGFDVARRLRPLAVTGRTAIAGPRDCLSVRYQAHEAGAAFFAKHSLEAERLLALV